LSAYQADDRGVVRKDSQHVGAAFDFLVETLKWVFALDLAPMQTREMEEYQQLFLGGIHHRHGAGELLAHNAMTCF